MSPKIKQTTMLGLT